jgi:hypothetical protein
MHLDMRIGSDDVETAVAGLIAPGAKFLHNSQQGAAHLGHAQRPGGQRVLRIAISLEGHHDHPLWIVRGWLRVG